jgi:transcriptional regulator with XRE-family HTH domain
MGSLIDHPLARARKDAGLTQAQLAHRSGICIRAISNAEAGISPRGATKTVLALALGKHVDEIWRPARPVVQQRRAA